MTYVLQFAFLAIVTREGFLARFVGNTLYFAGANLYMYHTFLGYQGFLLLFSPFAHLLLALPFISKAVVFVYPIGIATIIYIISLFTFNFSQIVLDAYFK